MPPRVAAAVGVLLLVLGTLAVKAGAAEHQRSPHRSSTPPGWSRTTSSNAWMPS